MCKACKVWVEVQKSFFSIAHTCSHTNTSLKFNVVIHVLHLNMAISGLIMDSSWFVGKRNTNSLSPETHTYSYLHTPICTCIYLYCILSVEHLSLHCAEVNSPFPWREGPTNEVNCMPLHCVTHWGSLAAAWTPTPRGNVLLLGYWLILQWHIDFRKEAIMSLLTCLRSLFSFILAKKNR